MFFSFELLIRQYGGVFATPWIAATRGVTHISKKDIRECELQIICDNLERMVLSTSMKPRLRLSLSLSIRLINGVTRIYKRQVELYLDDLVAFLGKVRRPKIELILSQASSGDTQEAPIARVQRKRKRQTVQLSDDIVRPAGELAVIGPEQFVQMEIDKNDFLTLLPPGDIEQFTLQEEVPIPPRIEMTALGDYDMLEGPEHHTIPDMYLRPRPSVPKPQAATPTKRKAKSTEHTTPVKIRVASQPKPTLVPPPLEEDAIEFADVRPLQDEQVVCEAPVQPEKPQESDNATSEFAIPKKRPPKNILNKLLIRTSARRFVNINRIGWDEWEIMDLSEMENMEVPTLIKPKETDLYHLLEDFRLDNELDDIFLNEIELTERSRSSLMRSKISFVRPLARPNKTTELPEVVQQHESHMLVLEPVQEIEALDEPISRNPLPIAASTEIYLNNENISALHRTEEVIVPPAAQRDAVEKAVVTTSPSGSDKRRQEISDRHSAMISIIDGWNTEERGEITLEDVCMKPVNRRNIAVAFNDLLYLQKMKYIIMYNKQDSLELGRIAKGARLL